MESLGIGRLPDPAFWSRQRVLLTGHTGFKGSWFSLWLEKLGAEVFGFALAPDTSPNLYERLAPFARHVSQLGDIRDRDALARAVAAARPTIAIHMAAQPLVRRSYREPLETFAVNVTGTANLLEALRDASVLKTVLVVTTDKVYRHCGPVHAFTEDDPLGGDDPYSASKAAAELVVQSWRESFFREHGIAVATARAGNVIGGGDWAEDRLVPDIWRAAKAGQAVELRYPNATRPWQHVLDPLCGYLVYAEALTQKKSELPGALNFGPEPDASQTVSALTDAMLAALGAKQGWRTSKGIAAAEKTELALDARRAGAALGWRPFLSASSVLDWTAQWYRSFDDGGKAREISLAQLARYGAEQP